MAMKKKLFEDNSLLESQNEAQNEIPRKNLKINKFSKYDTIIDLEESEIWGLGYQNQNGVYILENDQNLGIKIQKDKRGRWKISDCDHFRHI